MITKLLTLFCLILLVISLNAQWTEQSSGTTQNLNDIYFFNADTGLVVGNGGTILKTFNGGVNWTGITSPVYNKLTSIDFVDDSIGYISCQDGMVLKTLDGGNSWDVIETGFSIDLEEVQSYDEEKIWACGSNKIIYSNDNGLTWDIEFEESWPSFTTLFQMDSNHIWAATPASAYHKVSNNPDWELIFFYYPSGGSSLPSIFFTDLENGWMIHNHYGVGYGGHNVSDIYYTNVLGDSLECRYTFDWEDYPFGDNSMSLSDIYFVNNTGGWVVGGHGYIFKTENAGYDWEWQFSGTEEHLRSVFFADSTNGWIVGENGIILYTDNSGSNSCLCLPQGITFTTQSHIDSFQINHPICTEILGEVVISGNNITNLNSLSMLTSIGEFLEVKNNNTLTSLSGLDNLTSIGEDLLIWDNPALTSLTGLENLSFLPGNLTIGGHSYSNPQYNCKGNFSLNNLNGLDNLNSIGGNVQIYCNDTLTNLSGLESLTTIGGDLLIGKVVSNYYDTLYGGNPLLNDLTGLNNLASIEGSLTVKTNNALTSLAGLEYINLGIFGNLTIVDNESLVSCEAQGICDYLASPSGTIDIYNNAPGCNNPPEIAAACGTTMPCLPYGNFYFFTQSDIDDFQANYPDCFDLGGNVVISGSDISNLDGLSMLTSIGGNLLIEDNPLLFSLSGFLNLTSIGGNLQVINNDKMEELTGLNNIDPASIENIKITKNDSLAICDVESICHYLLEPGGNINIGNNAQGCNNQNQVMIACGLAPCLPEGILFATQGQVDSFQYNYPNCPKIAGNVTIQGDDIINFNGLQILTSIEGDLIIQFNNNLIDISGLGNLKYVNGMFRMQNNSSLTTLSGLDSLTLIGDNFEIYTNASLSNLSGLENLEMIENALKIVNNNSLPSLVGLENVNAGSIENLQISSNDVLSNCQAENICDYLLIYNGAANINNNAPGCNSKEEVEAACLTDIEEVRNTNNLCIIPNPLGSSSLITYTLGNSSFVTLKILDLSGREVVTLVDEVQQQGEKRVRFKSDALPAGVYFCVLKTNEGILTRKIIKL